MFSEQVNSGATVRLRWARLLRSPKRLDGAFWLPNGCPSLNLKGAWAGYLLGYPVLMLCTQRVAPRMSFPRSAVLVLGAGLSLPSRCLCSVPLPGV